MASLPLDNPYTVQGTVLYEVIPSDAYRAQMLGKTNISTPTEETLTKSSTAASVTFKGVAGSGSRGAAAGRGAASSNSAAGSHHAGADGHLLSSSAASATAALRAQRDQQYQSALAGSFTGVTRSGAVLGGGRRTGPAASILLPGASKVAVRASRKPGRLAPLGSEEMTESGGGGGGGGAMMTAATDGNERNKAGPSATGQSLTVERALAQLFPPVAIASSRNSTESTEEENKEVKGRALSATRQEKEGSLVRTPPPEWMQVAATDHTSRIDVVLLHQHLLQRCQDEHARPAGCLCATREAIFNDGYQELMRQVTVMCPERGLLLEELDQNMALSSEAYDALFDSACQYAARKSIERDLRSYLFDDKKKLESEVRRLENRVNELRAKHDGLLKRFEEQKASTQKVQEEELNYLKKANQQLISEIKRLSTMESAMNAATKASADGA